MSWTKPILFSLFFMVFHLINAQDNLFPAEHWLQYKDPTEAGFSREKLDSLREKFKVSGGKVLLVIHNGAILLNEGPITRRFRQASIRKSFLSALIGIYVEKGKINLNNTMADLGINDNQKLTEKELTAKVIDLMRSRSGIYLPAAYSVRGAEKYLPKRGSKEIGTHWHYNNWDFNTLGTIFNQETGMDLFQAFKQHLAKPLQMEDFRMIDTYYRLEKDKSEYPAYLFRMSPRDMARFGLLFLNKGQWKGQQIIPAKWVEESTRTHTKDLGWGFQNRGAYGLMWWIANDIEGEPMYYASGAGGQRICVFPKSNLVLVHVTDTYQQKNVREEQIQEMCRLLLLAKEDEVKKEPQLNEITPKEEKIETVQVTQEQLEQYEGVYFHRALGKFKVTSKENQLLVEAGIGYFYLTPTSNNTFYNTDIAQKAEFQKGTSEQKNKVKAQVNAKREVEKIIFYY